MDNPGRRPLVLVLCGWPRDRELVGILLNALGADMRAMGELAELRELLAEDRVDLVLADTAIGIGSLGDLLRFLDGSAEAADIPMVLLADHEDLDSLADLTAGRFNAVLLTKPLAREQLAAAVASGLRLRDRQRQVWALLRQVEAANARLARANVELERRRDEAADEARRRTRFLAAISHDIRTPVNALVLTSQLLQKAGRGRVGPAEIEELTETLRTNAEALVELVNDLLDIARYDQGKLEFHEAEFPLGEFLSKTLEGLRPLAEQKSLALESEIETPDAVLRTDRVKLARVIQNLVSNAIKFTERGEVRVNVRADTARGLVMTVRDTGMGIPEALRESIFDEFSQLRNPERDRTKGTGLGLAICRRLVSSMGGEIRVASEPGQSGSTFLVTLPADRVVSSAGPSPDGHCLRPAKAETRFSGRVLIVEDHEPSRRILRRVIEGFGPEVDLAVNGREALERLEQVRPDLVLLDLMMPEMGGLDVLRVVRGRPELAGLAVVILTGDLNEHGDERLLREGAIATLSKPVDLPKLLSLFERFLAAEEAGKGRLVQSTPPSEFVEESGPPLAQDGSDPRFRASGLENR